MEHRTEAEQSITRRRRARASPSRRPRSTSERVPSFHAMRQTPWATASTVPRASDGASAMTTRTARPRSCSAGRAGTRFGGGGNLGGGSAASAASRAALFIIALAAVRARARVGPLVRRRDPGRDLVGAGVLAGREVGLLRRLGVFGRVVVDHIH